METNIKTDTYDVIVVGGGPAGSTIASILAREGGKVILFHALVVDGRGRARVWICRHSYPRALQPD